jgi:hypothetical protein
MNCMIAELESLAAVSRHGIHFLSGRIEHRLSSSVVTTEFQEGA